MRRSLWTRGRRWVVRAALVASRARACRASSWNVRDRIPCCGIAHPDVLPSALLWGVRGDGPVAACPTGATSYAICRRGTGRRPTVTTGSRELNRADQERSDDDRRADRDTPPPAATGSLNARSAHRCLCPPVWRRGELADRGSPSTGSKRDRWSAGCGASTTTTARWRGLPDAAPETAPARSPKATRRTRMPDDRAGHRPTSSRRNASSPSPRTTTWCASRSGRR